VPESEPAAQGFREELRELGYVQEPNIVIEWRWTAGDVEVEHQ
jgi:hypothetical protein